MTLPEGTREIVGAPGLHVHGERQELSVQQLKPGMAGTATITRSTTVTPVTATEVKNGKVGQASGASIIVRTDDGFKMFTQGDVDKRGVKDHARRQTGGRVGFPSGRRAVGDHHHVAAAKGGHGAGSERDIDGQWRPAIVCHAEPRRGRCPGCGGLARVRRDQPRVPRDLPLEGRNGAERRGDGTSGPRNGSERCGPCGGAIGWSGCRTRGCCSRLDQQFVGHLLVGGRPPDPGGTRPHDAPPFQGLIRRRFT